jgi:carboxylesterase type B
MLQQYPLLPSERHDVRNRTARIVTDGLFKCPARSVGLLRAANSQPAPRPTWEYHFDHVGTFMAPVWAGKGGCPDCVDRVCHAEELAFVFHCNISQVGPNISWAQQPAEEKLATSMVDYWAGFTHSQEPGSGSAGQPLAWPPVGAAEESSMYFRAEGNTIRKAAYQDKCKFWDNTGYDWLFR